MQAHTSSVVIKALYIYNKLKTLVMLVIFVSIYILAIESSSG